MFLGKRPKVAELFRVSGDGRKPSKMYRQQDQMHQADQNLHQSTVIVLNLAPINAVRIEKHVKVIKRSPYFVFS